MMHDVIVKNDLGEVKFNLDESGWVRSYRDYLDQGRITISDGVNLSVDTAGHRWVMFYRTLGYMRGGSGSVKVLCVGWQDTIGGVNIKALNWVYPNGFIESAEEPTFWRLFT